MATLPRRCGRLALYMYGFHAMRNVISRLRSHCSSVFVGVSAP